MTKRTIFLFFLIVLCIPAVVFADNGVEKSSMSGKKVFRGFNLTGSKQGQAIGFADVDGDGVDDRIVGAPYALSASSTGALLIYRGNADGEFSSSPAMLLEGDDNFGFSFVNLGDVDSDGREDYAVGAIHGDGPDVSLCGSVTVYRGGKHKARKKVITKLSGEGPMDKFGLSLSAGDLNGDGKKDLISGAPFNTNDPSLYQGGAVYVYFAPDFATRVALHASSKNKGLGWSMATGDLNGDNIADLCISASGKVLCYYGSADFSPTTDTPDVTIKSSSAGFGRAIAITGDLNADGYGEILIGAPYSVINGQRDTGSVYIVKGGLGTRILDLNSPSSDLIVRIDGTGLFDRFGSSISNLGDIDGTQKDDFAVGAPMADSETYSLAGRVYLFMGEEISDTATLANAPAFEGSSADQGYGTSILAAKNNILLVGAPGAENNTGAISLVDPASGQTVTDNPGGITGGNGDCH